MSTGARIILATTIVTLRCIDRPDLGAYRSLSFLEGTGNIRDRLLDLYSSLREGFTIEQITDGNGNPLLELCTGYEHHPETGMVRSCTRPAGHEGPHKHGAFSF